MTLRKDIIDRKQEILQWISENQTLSYMSKMLNCKIDTLKAYFVRLEINYSGNQGRKGLEHNERLKPISYYLTDDPNIYIGAYKLKFKLFKEGIKEKRCECCGNTTWLGEEIPLELHHIDGNKHNNLLSNLQILCPNCHARTETYRGKNTQLVRSKKAAELVKQENTTSLSLVASAYEFDSHTPYQSKKRASAKTISKHNSLAVAGKIDSIGRTNENYLSNDEWEKRKELILNSGVDFSKYGWKTQVEKKTGLTRRQVCRTVNHFPEIFNNIVFNRANNK